MKKIYFLNEHGTILGLLSDLKQGKEKEEGQDAETDVFMLISAIVSCDFIDFEVISVLRKALHSFSENSLKLSSFVLEERSHKGLGRHEGK